MASLKTHLNSSQPPEMEGKWPIARVTAVVPVRDRSNNINLLKVACCPLCNKAHTHGGGSIGGPLLLGHRVAHCRGVKRPLRVPQEPGGYVLRLGFAYAAPEGVES
jgi:hypothetical protein